MRLMRSIAGILCCVGAVAATLAMTRAEAPQAAREDAPQPGAERERPPHGEPYGGERLRQMLERRLEESTSRLEREQINQRILQRALDRLDAGDSPHEVFGELRRGQARAERSLREPSGDEGEIERGRLRRGQRDEDRPQRERVLSAMREHMPSLAERIVALRDEDPERAQALLDRLGPAFREALELRERDPELAGLKVEQLRANLEMYRASRALHAAGEGDDAQAKDRARRALVEALHNSFDAHLAVAHAEVERLEQRLDRLRRDIEQRERQRQTLIDAQLRRLDETESPQDADGG